MNEAPDSIWLVNYRATIGAGVWTPLQGAETDVRYVRADLAKGQMPHVNDLAQIIRRVDGDHSLGAGALAEAILAALAD